jgi:micrococcal nuclease
MRAVVGLMYIAVVVAFFSLGVVLVRLNPPHLVQNPYPTPEPSYHPTEQPYEIATVAAVIDGDTVTLTDKRKLRYIGIDTPETKHPTKGIQCFGIAASQENKRLVEGKTIKMQKDVSETDRYGRLLRYVWVDELFVNDYLARNGFALQATFPPDVRYTTQFREAADEARQKKRGLWNMCK